jgi:hypothetical protein
LINSSQTLKVLQLRYIDAQTLKVWLEDLCKNRVPHLKTGKEGYIVRFTPRFLSAGWAEELAAL